MAWVQSIFNYFSFFFLSCCFFFFFFFFISSLSFSFFTTFALVHFYFHFFSLLSLGPCIYIYFIFFLLSFQQTFQNHVLVDLSILLFPSSHLVFLSLYLSLSISLSCHTFPLLSPSLPTSSDIHDSIHTHQRPSLLLPFLPSSPSYLPTSYRVRQPASHIHPRLWKPLLGKRCIKKIQTLEVSHKGYINVFFLLLPR